MPRYFFNLDNARHEEDDEGTELRDDDQAKVQAVMFAGEHLRDHPEMVWEGGKLRVEVMREDRAPVLSLHITANQPTG